MVCGSIGANAARVRGVLALCREIESQLQCTSASSCCIGSYVLFQLEFESRDSRLEVLHDSLAVGELLLQLCDLSIGALELLREPIRALELVLEFGVLVLQLYMTASAGYQHARCTSKGVNGRARTS